MFGIFKRKRSWPEYKSYTFHYHRVCSGDSRTITFEKCISFVEAVNKLSDAEKENWFYIDWVEEKEME